MSMVFRRSRFLTSVSIPIINVSEGLSFCLVHEKISGVKMSA